MRQLCATLVLALTLPLASAADKKPGVDAFFDAMAIDVAPGEQARFVVGDNLAGYFEGYTQSYAKGAGYQLSTTALFQDYASYRNGLRNERSDAAEQVLPYGHRARFRDGGDEEMALLSKQRALALRVSAPSASTLAIDSLLALPLERFTISRVGELVLLTPRDGAAPFMVLAADQPVTLTQAAPTARPALMLTSVQPATELTVVVAFGDSADQACAGARALAHTRPIAAERAVLYAALTNSYLATDDAAYNKALNWAKASSRMFVVEEFGTGIWAGLPWFRDNWGRDTFIALPGTLLVSGQFAQARAVLANFARYQNLREPREAQYGRIPNRVSRGDIIYNSVDGTPWMLREGLEYIRYTGDKAFAAELYRLALPYFDGAIANDVDADGLLRHDDADTWMDARIDNRQPWSARGPRAVEIQALWYSALQTGAYLASEAGDQARAQQWRALARTAQASFLRLFWDGTSMADRLRADASRDTKVRPNQLMLITIPTDEFVPRAVQAKVLKNAVSELLYPYGIASLSQNDPYFHPRHENPAHYHKDAAYHQGTIWGWNAGFTVGALNEFGYQDLAWQLSQNLGQQILHLGTLGTMSELLDALPDQHGALRPSGTFAQSWSVAEYARNAYQDYVGFHPDLLANTLALRPAIPGAWRTFHAELPFGQGEQLVLDFARTRTGQRWLLHLNGNSARTLEFTAMNADKSRAQLHVELMPGKPVVLDLANGRATLNGKALALTPVQASFAASIGELHFQTPGNGPFPVLQGRDVLKDIILRNEYR